MDTTNKTDTGKEVQDNKEGRMNKEQSKNFFNAIDKMVTEDGLLTLLEKKDKQLAQSHDFNSEFRKGFLLAEDIVKEWAKKNYPLTKKK